jgi:hypothetical protein
MPRFGIPRFPRLLLSLLYLNSLGSFRLRNSEIES